MEQRQQVSQRLTCTCRRLADNVFTVHRQRYNLLLYRCRLVNSCFFKGLHQFLAYAQFFGSKYEEKQDYNNDPNPAAATIKTIILDEADRLLDDQNIEGIKAVIKTTMRDRQMLLFSATITAAAFTRAQELMREPVMISAAGQDKVAPEIEHMYIVSDQRDKTEALRKLARIIQGERGLVFVNKSEEIDLTVDKLNYLGLSAAGIHGSSVKTDRKKALEDFRAGRIQLLVASDVAARGLDIQGVDYIFNLDLPEDPQIYLHRAGRTGRAGREGIAVSIVNQREAAFISKIEKDLQITIAARHIERGMVVELPTPRRTRTGGAPRKKVTAKQDKKPRS
jgi:superfamily II DNA/RNA helicase